MALSFASQELVGPGGFSGELAQGELNFLDVVLHNPVKFQEQRVCRRASRTATRVGMTISKTTTVFQASSLNRRDRQIIRSRA